MDLKYLLFSSSWMTVRRSQDPRSHELRRLRPYYKGTRQLSGVAVFMVLLSLLLPLTVPFVRMEGFVNLLILYIILIIVVVIGSILIESVTDAIYAIQFERRCSLKEAIAAFIRYYKADTAYMIEYMIIKQVVDTVLMTLVMALYIPAALEAIVMMQSLIIAVTAGERDVAGLATPWLVAITISLILAMLVTSLLSAPMAAFYGYYTEESVRIMRHLDNTVCEEATEL